MTSMIFSCTAARPPSSSSPTKGTRATKTRSISDGTKSLIALNPSRSIRFTLFRSTAPPRRFETEYPTLGLSMARPPVPPGRSK